MSARQRKNREKILNSLLAWLNIEKVTPTIKATKDRGIGKTWSSVRCSGVPGDDGDDDDGYDDHDDSDNGDDDDNDDVMVKMMMMVM